MLLYSKVNSTVVRDYINTMKMTLYDNASLLYAESISAWSNQGSVMCLLSILKQ